MTLPPESGPPDPRPPDALSAETLPHQPLPVEQLRRRLRLAPHNRQPMLHRIFRADPSTVRDALLYLRERFDGSAGTEVLSRLELALAEVLNNICEHGGTPQPDPLHRPHSPLVHLFVVRHVGGIACAVTDDGRPLPVECLDPRNLPHITDEAEGIDHDILLLPEGGFGWYLIQDLTASLSYFREGRRNFLVFIVPVDKAEAMPGNLPF